MSLFPKFSSQRWKQPPREAGMEPLRRLLARYRSVRFFKSPTSSTMLPVNLLEDRFKNRRELSLRRRDERSESQRKECL